MLQEFDRMDEKGYGFYFAFLLLHSAFGYS